MGCGKLDRIDMLEYVLGRLPQDRLDQVKVHIAECHLCAEDLPKARRVADALELVRGCTIFDGSKRFEESFATVAREIMSGFTEVVKKEAWKRQRGRKPPEMRSYKTKKRRIKGRWRARILKAVPIIIVVVPMLLVAGLFSGLLDRYWAEHSSRLPMAVRVAGAYLVPAAEDVARELAEVEGGNPRSKCGRIRRLYTLELFGETPRLARLVCFDAAIRLCDSGAITGADASLLMRLPEQAGFVWPSDARREAVVAVLRQAVSGDAEGARKKFAAGKSTESQYFRAMLTLEAGDEKEGFSLLAGAAKREPWAKFCYGALLLGNTVRKELAGDTIRSLPEGRLREVGLELLKK